MDSGVPVIASVECRSQLSWRDGIRLAVEHMADLVGIFSMHTIQRQTGETLGQSDVQSIHFLAASEIVICTTIRQILLML